MDTPVRFIVNRAGAVREAPVENGRVVGFVNGSDLFHDSDRAAMEAKALEIRAMLEGKAVPRG
jgi:hypothetical protein